MLVGRVALGGAADALVDIPEEGFVLREPLLVCDVHRAKVAEC